MKITAEDLRRHYRSLSDAELLSLEKDDLTEIGRQCYDEELARRSLAPESEAVTEPEALAGEPAADAVPPEEVVAVAFFTLRDEANLARSVLESAEIRAYLPEDDTTGLDHGLANALGGLPLMVPASCLEQARELLRPQIAEANKAFLGRWFDQEWSDNSLSALLSGIQVTVLDMFAEGDKVATRVSIRGTHQTQAVEFGGIVIARVIDGRVVEEWSNLDRLGLLTQIGAVSPDITRDFFPG